MKIRMRAARELKLGGVGWYPCPGFFYIDTGLVRNWTLNEKGLDNLVGGNNGAFQEWAPTNG